MALTQYPEGSIRELCKLSFPLMLSALSVVSMVFVDRLFLANYSTAAFNAIVNAMTLGWVFIFSWMILCGIAEVFVAQYNGAGQKTKLGEPIWQMLWLNLFSFLFFIPLGLWVGEWIYGRGAEFQMERDYLRLMLFCGPFFGLYSTLCAFFIGQGKTRLISFLAVISNLTNVILDYFLIFGIPGVFEPMGIVGAAIATSASNLLQAMVLGVIFLKRENRQLFGTGNWKLRPVELGKCFKIGLPGSVYICIEMVGWSCFYQMMAVRGETYLTIAGIGQSLVILLYFFAEGVNKAVATITGNLIGAGRNWIISKVLWSGFVLNFVFFLVLLFAFSLCFNQIVQLFLPQIDMDANRQLYDSLKFFCLSMCVYMLFEGIRMVFIGLLTAAGDTMFLMLAGSTAMWAFLVIPVYYFIVQMKYSIEAAAMICIFFSLMTCSIYLLRFLAGQWKTIDIVA